MSSFVSHAHDRYSYNQPGASDFMPKNNDKSDSEEDNCYTVITSANNKAYFYIEVPEEFTKKVLVHVVSHYIGNNTFFEPPQFLVIEGPAGEGKTAQTIATLTQHDIDVVYVSGSQLSGNHERDALNVMNKIYCMAQQRLNKNNTAIIIDDFHMSILNQDSSMKKTINTNILTGFLMNLSTNCPGQTVPIILTGNDFSMVYAPLLRSGRADRFKWVPNHDVKIKIVQSILQGIIHDFSQEKYEAFFNQFQNGSIADFAQLKNDCRKKYVWNIIQNKPRLNRSVIAHLNSDLSSCPDKVSFDELYELALKRFNNNHPNVDSKGENESNGNGFITAETVN